MSKREKVGMIGVDAGICWIGDPCYIFHKEELNKPKEIGKDWGEFCSKLNFQQGSQQFNYDGGNPGLGVVVSTGYGDGHYPVYIKRNEEGRVTEVTVKFI